MIPTIRGDGIGLLKINEVLTMRVTMEKKKKRKKGYWRNGFKGTRQREREREGEREAVHPREILMHGLIVAFFELSRCSSDLSPFHQAPLIGSGCTDAVRSAPRTRSGSYDKKESFIHALNPVSA